MFVKEKFVVFKIMGTTKLLAISCSRKVSRPLTGR